MPTVINRTKGRRLNEGRMKETEDWLRTKTAAKERKRKRRDERRMKADRQPEGEEMIGTIGDCARFV